MTQEKLGVGLIGAGPVVQSIHLPTLLRLQRRFAIRRVMDVDPLVAEAVAGRAGGAAWGTSVNELLDDPTVDVVAICSPAQFHAEQVIQAIRSGKRAVLCEKPFVTSRDEAASIAAASRDAAVPVFVGTMHTFDPGWQAASTAWPDLAGETHTVRSRIALPANTRYEDWATELRARPSGRPVDLRDPQVRAAMFVDGILGLATHNLPHVRAFLPQFENVRVEHAQFFEPWGYLALLSAGGRIVQLTGIIHERCNPQWSFDAIGTRSSLHMEFTPSFVHAGSAVAKLRTGDSTTVLGPFPANGYQAEWERISDAVHGDLSAVPPLQTLIDDLRFAIDIAEQSAAMISEERAA